MPDPEELPIFQPEPDKFDNENSAMQYIAKAVRRYLRDQGAKNNLLLGEREHTWEDIYDAVEDTLADLNVTTPNTSYTLVSIPKVARGLLYVGAAAYCLRSAANLQARNQNQFSDQGWSASESDKAPLYMQIAQALEADYEDKKVKWKASVNIQAAWGGVWSDELYASGYGFDGYFG